MGSTKDKAVTIPHRCPGSSPPVPPTGSVDASPLALRRYIPPPGPPPLLLVAMRWGLSIAMVSNLSRLDSSGTQRQPSRHSLSFTPFGCASSYAPYWPACTCRGHHVTRKLEPKPRPTFSADSCRWTIKGDHEGFPSLPDVLFADVTWGPTNTSLLHTFWVRLTLCTDGMHHGLRTRPR